MNQFKSKHTFDERKNESSRVLSKYPDRVPIILQKTRKSKLDIIDKEKYLVPVDLTCGQFIYVIRKRLKLPSEKAIFIFVDGSIPCTNNSLSLVYHNSRDLDGFLYIEYSEENVFGKS